MLKFTVSEDRQWLIMSNLVTEVEKRQIEISLTKKVNNWFFHPLVKKKIWDGNVCFVEKKGLVWRVPVGLWMEIFSIGKEFGYEVQIEGLDSLILSDLTLEDFQNWTTEFFADKEIKPRDYQIEAAWKIVKYRYSVSEIATSSGKTLIAFMILAFLKSRNYIRKFLMIVPSTNLVFQGNDDFLDYGIGELGVKIQQIGGGSKIREGCDVIIGTFQSLVKQEQDFFEGIDAVFVDECLSPDSLISMSDGTFKKISEVKVDDIVLTVNEKSGHLEEKKVDFVYKNLNKDKQMYEIETECGKILKLTGNHKVKLKNCQWKKVEDLSPFDELYDI